MQAATGSKPWIGRHLLTLEPQFRERIWGGHRLRAANPPIGEAWIAYGGSQIQSGPFAGSTLDELVEKEAEAVLGSAVLGRYGKRIPMLIKLLDCADWLSLQVHPNDEQARRMVGPNAFGKTEAWYFLDTDPEARILLGVKPGTTPDSLAAAIRAGRALDVAQEVDVQAGEAVLIPAGTLHASGPGLFIYEIQQASDITYRAYDWDRPETAERKLHIEESAEVAQAVGPLPRSRPLVGPDCACDCAGEYGSFELQLCAVGETPLASDTAGLSFHVITAIEGTVRVRCGAEMTELAPYETAFIPAAAGEYEIAAKETSARVLRARVPDGSPAAFRPGSR